MTKLSKNAEEKFELLKGTETWSLKYEGCVYVDRKGDVFMDGEKVDTLNTSAKVNKLWREYVKNELG